MFHNVTSYYYCYSLLFWSNKCFDGTRCDVKKTLQKSYRPFERQCINVNLLNDRWLLHLSYLNLLLSFYNISCDVFRWFELIDQFLILHTDASSGLRPLGIASHFFGFVSWQLVRTRPNPWRTCPQTSTQAHPPLELCPPPLHCPLITSSTPCPSAWAAKLAPMGAWAMAPSPCLLAQWWGSSRRSCHLLPRLSRGLHHHHKASQG